MASFELNPASLDKIKDFVITKQVPHVIKQTPAPGTPVIPGLTTEVQAVSYSDIPYYIVDADAPPAIRNLPIAEIGKVVAEDDTVKTAVTTGTASDPAAFAEKLSAGFARGGVTTAVSAADTPAIVRSLNLAGFRNF